MKKFLLILLLAVPAITFAQEKSVAEKLAQEQLDAYNNRDIEAFLKPYSDSVTVYLYPNRLLYTGKATMRSEYAAMFKNTPDLHCTLKNRIVVGNTVIDEESVVFNKNQPPLHAAAIYTIAGDRIVSVQFVSER